MLSLPLSVQWQKAKQEPWSPTSRGALLLLWKASSSTKMWLVHFLMIPHFILQFSDLLCCGFCCCSIVVFLIH